MLASAAVLGQLVLALAASLSLVVANADAKLSSENGHAGSSRMSIKLRSPSSHAVSAARRDQIVDYKRLGVNQNPFNLAAQNITWSTTPFNPTGIPLAVRSPYVSTWLWGGTHDRFGDLTAQQPSFWNGNSLPWCGTVMVDGIVYTWMGVPAQCAPGGRAAVQESLSFTASQTVFSFTAGAVNVTATFLSPLTPTDLVRQSLPYSYLNVSVTSIDGQAHSVQMYTDITGEWASNDWTRTIQWGNSVLNNTLQVHHFQLTDPVLYGEAADSCLYGQVVYATYMDANTTYQSGPSSSLRQAFATQGRLSNTPDTTYRAIDNDQPAFGFAKDLGTISGSQTGSGLFVVGHYRDPGVLFSAINSTNQNRSLYFMSEYPSMESSLSFFYNDYEEVAQMSADFDAQIQSAASGNVTSNYAALCAIAARQVYSGLEITVGKDASGNYNTSDTMVFVKEIATSNYVNTVDVMNPAFPFWAYTNPDMIAYAILPVLLYSEQTFPATILSAPHDIGTAYPVADGAHQVDAPYYIEECANMLFMALAHAVYSGKTDLVQQHYTILKQWADYLVNGTVYPIYQSSTDDFKGRSANSTSLAVKGAVGIGCMGAIASLVGNAVDSSNYNSTAQRYANEIVSNAIASTNDHLKLTYQSDDSSWSQLYNLYPDKLFGLGIFNDTFYAMQGDWYSSKALMYGIPLDSQSDGTKTDFSLWMAGVYHDNSTLRDTFIDGVYNFLSYGSSGQAVPDYYDANNATQIGGFVDRPVVGGIYAPLLQSVPFASSSNSGSTPQSQRRRARNWLGL